MQLNGFYSRSFLDFHGINVAVYVGFHHSHTQAVLDAPDKLDECSCLAAAGRGHEIEQKYSLALQLGTEFIGLAAVLLEYAFFNFYDSYFAHYV